MSVVRQKRGDSQLQFLDTARDLEIFSLKNCIKFPKRYTFLFTNEIAHLAISILNNVKAANSIFPTNEHEVEMRRDYFTKANCNLQCLITQLGVAKEVCGENIKTSTWCHWMDLCETEAKLISAVKKRDRERARENKM